MGDVTMQPSAESRISKARLMISDSAESPEFRHTRSGVSNRCICSAPLIMMSDSLGVMYVRLEFAKHIFRISFFRSLGTSQMITAS